MRPRTLRLVLVAVLLVAALVAVALAFGGRETLPMDPGTPSTVTTIGGGGR